MKKKKGGENKKAEEEKKKKTDIQIRRDTKLLWYSKYIRLSDNLQMEKIQHGLK